MNFYKFDDSDDGTGIDLDSFFTECETSNLEDFAQSEILELLPGNALTDSPYLHSAPTEIVQIDDGEEMYHNLWTLYYRQGSNPSLTKNFALNGTLKDAQQRGMAHCTIMGLTFIFVKPLIIDLQAEELRKPPKHEEQHNNEEHPKSAAS